ncbi:hypothetical protein [Streptomyces sp. NPDC093149]|uniref:hypothetical protein n=1 Tax=Streptomyces sp. NPDC093149 TaxID=3366031 RepID=UPI00382AEF55
MPFRHHFVQRNWELEDRLLTSEAATHAYRELAREGDLVMPVFLAVAVARARRPEDLWTRLAELRSQARAFRKHRGEFDESLRLGEVSDTSRQLLMAVRSEAVKLTEMCGHGFSLVTKILGRIAGVTPPQLPEEVSTLLGIASSELPAELRRRTRAAQPPDGPTGPQVSRQSLLADLANLTERNTRLARHITQLERRLSEALGQEAWHRSGLGAPGDIDTLHQQIAHLKQQVADLNTQLTERNEDLEAARATNRELMTQLNR